MSVKKPPLGVIPELFWKDRRIKDLQRAILEYMADGRTISPEWVEEYNRLITERSDG